MDPLFQKTKLIMLDAGSTLLTEDTCYHDRIIRTIAINHATCTEADFYRLFEKASVLRLNPYQYAVKELGLKTIVPWDFSSEKLYPGVIETLTVLKKHYRLAIVANQPVGFPPRVHKMGLDPYFDLVIGSDDYGFRKPDPRIFLSAIDGLHVRPEEAVMVGDRLENDIAPAKALGCLTIWVKQGLSRYQEVSTDAEKPTRIIQCIKDLQGIFDY
jgi:HAD superfamily hydrolase (TIGR01549 family)